MSKTHLIALALLLLSASATTSAQAQVWKCTVDGKTRYSDQPCSTKAEQLKPQALQSNIIDTTSDRAAAERAKAVAETERQAASTPPPTAPAARSNVCPSDRDIASMETKASSISLSPSSKRFVQDEIRRAHQCQKGQGNYSAADWNLSKQAVDAQSSVTGGADARHRAEAMHSAADATEGERIARQRADEEREAQRRARQGQVVTGR